MTKWHFFSYKWNFLAEFLTKCRLSGILVYFFIVHIFAFIFLEELFTAADRFLRNSRLADSILLPVAGKQGTEDAKYTCYNENKEKQQQEKYGK